MKARKLILAAALALSMGAGASAQDEWEFGVKGGIALNMMPGTTIDAGDRYQANFGFQGGAYAAFYISDMWIAQLEILYSRKGVSTINHAGEELLGGSALTFTRNIHYLQMPLLFGFHSLFNDKVKLMIGPELGVYLGNEVISNYVSPYSLDDYECNPLNLGLGLQATYYVIDCLGIDLKFDFGLTRTFKDSTADRGHNSAVQLGVSYRFGY